VEWITGVLIAALPVALVLVCPIAMFLMMRSMGGMSHSSSDLTKLTPEARLAHLEVAQAALAHEIGAARAELDATTGGVPERRAS